MIDPMRRRRIVTGEEPIDRVLGALPAALREEVLLGAAWLVPWRRTWTATLEAMEPGLTTAVRDRAVFADLPDQWVFFRHWRASMCAPVSTAGKAMNRLCAAGLAERRDLTGAPSLQYRRARGYRAR